MIVRSLIKPSEYHDSVSLMVAARDLSQQPGVTDASVVMGTEANKALLKAAGLLTPEVEAASPNDLVIAVGAETEAAIKAALAAVEALLSKKAAPQGEGAQARPKTMRSAAKTLPGANLAVISVAGRYAAAEAWHALRSGLHVLLFSDNVSIEDEAALKQYASQNGLLLMGPGAGTAILNGVALGFANVIRPGEIGIVSAAGTGLQEVSTLIDKAGLGITQGIGTGGRDLKEEVGGIMMLDGLKALQADPATKIIVLVSKPPSASVTRKVLEQVTQGDKPTVVCFMGGDPQLAAETRNAYPAITLQEGALKAIQLYRSLEAEPGQFSSSPGLPPVEVQIGEENHRLAAQAEGLRRGLAPSQKYLRGLFSGGTLCYEAQVIWCDVIPGQVFSNAPLDKADTLPDSTVSRGHTVVDLGEEEFTVGRPHPMIDNDLRIRRLLQEAQDPETAVILLDVVLGYGAHLDPASELGPAVEKAIGLAKAAGRTLRVVASVTGTEGDPQGLERQVKALEQAGVVVCPSNAAAARLTAHIVCAR